MITQVFADGGVDQSLIVEVVVRIYRSLMLGHHRVDGSVSQLVEQIQWHRSAVLQEHQSVPDSEAALFYINDLAEVGGAAAGTTGSATSLSAHGKLRCNGLKQTLSSPSRIDGCISVLTRSICRCHERMWVSPGPEDVPGLPAELYKAKSSAVHVVAKGRQNSDAANTVQVRLSIV
jgi:hypothetical protein